MAIIRAPRDNKFTILQNCIFEKKLSWRAVGLLAYLLSKPDNWKIKISDLIRQVADSDNPTGRDATYAILKELMKAGFLVRDGQGKSDDGTWGSANYYIYDVPVSSDSPCTDNPHTAQPHTAKASTLVSTEPEEVLREISTDKKNSALRKSGKSEKPELPEWLDPKSWQDWLDHRKDIKHPVTALAARKAINELSRLKAQGHDPVTVIEHSILNGWRGLFPPKPEIHPARKQRDPFAPPPDYDYSVKGTWFDPENHR